MKIGGFEKILWTSVVEINFFVDIRGRDEWISRKLIQNVTSNSNFRYKKWQQVDEKNKNYCNKKQSVHVSRRGIEKLRPIEVFR